MSPKDTDTGYTGSPSKARSTMMQVLTATYKEEVVLFMIWASTAVQKQNK
jgi:ABC-type proline/glycine betaine transport system substrate-binding protein